MVEETIRFSGVSSKRAPMDLWLCRITLSRLQQRAAAGRALVAYRKKWQCLALGQVPGVSFLLEKTPEARQQKCSLSEPCPTRSHRVATPYWRLHQPGSPGLACPGDYLRLHPIQLTHVLSCNRPHYSDRGQSSST